MSVHLRIGSEAEDWAAILTLLRDSFAYMESRIDPPSSLARWSPVTVAAEAERGLIILGEDTGHIVACAFAKASGDALYVGKVAVAKTHRGQGILRRIVAMAGNEAQRRGLHQLTLQSRIELTQNHAAFAALGFVEVARTAHQGYDQATSVTMRRPV